jgi:hypothetical protein
MAKLLKLRRGSTSQHSSFTGAEGEVTVDTDKDVLVVNDGSTAGGHPLAAEDMSNVSSASIAGRLATDSIATTKIAGGALPTDVTVASANIVDGTIVNADVNASAAIDGTKIAPNFGSQNLSTTGNLSGAALTLSNNNLIINGTQPNISFVDSDANPDYLIKVNGGTFDIRDNTSDSSMFSIGSGELAAQGKLNLQAGLDTDGDVQFNTGSTNVNVLFDASTSNMKFSDSMSLSFGDHSTTGDYSLAYVNGGDFTINAMSGGSADLIIGRYENATQKKHIVSTRAGVAELYHDNSKKLNTAAGGIEVTGDITITGSVDGADVGAMNTTLATLSSVNGSLANGVTATTQSASDNSTKVATTAYTDTAIANLVDSSPSALNTLNELAAALGDDANFSTTVTNSIATKMPLAGGTFTGDITCSGGAGAVSVSAASDIRIAGGTWTGEYTDGIKLQPDGNNSYFQYEGSLYFRDTAGNNRLTLDSSGNLTAAANVTAYSDASLKENVKTIDNALSIVGKLRGVSYNWNNKYGIGSHADIGVIAQEVEAVVPELVKTNHYEDPQYPKEQTDIKSVDYGKLTSILINAINELKAEVDALKGGS